MAAGGLDKRTDIGATEKTRGVRRGWEWQQKTNRCRRALEDDKDDGNKVDKGQIEAEENGDRQMAALREISRSLHHLSSGIRLPLFPSHLCSGAEEREVTVLALESEAALEEEVEDRRRLFRTCRWINCPFMHIRDLEEGVVAVAAAVLETEDGCIPRGVEVGR